MWCLHWHKGRVSLVQPSSDQSELHVAHNWNEFAVVGLNSGWTKKSFDSETENVVKPLKSWENIYVIL